MDKNKNFLGAFQEYTGGVRYRKRDIYWHVRSLLAQSSSSCAFGYFF